MILAIWVGGSIIGTIGLWRAAFRHHTPLNDIMLLAGVFATFPYTHLAINRLEQLRWFDLEFALLLLLAFGPPSVAIALLTWSVMKRAMRPTQ